MYQHIKSQCRGNIRQEKSRDDKKIESIIAGEPGKVLQMEQRSV